MSFIAYNEEVLIRDMLRTFVLKNKIIFSIAQIQNATVNLQYQHSTPTR